MPTQSSGFDGSNAFLKPAACEIHVEAKLDWTDRSATLGWRPGQRKIHYEARSCAGHFDLSKPLCQMTQAELDHEFPVTSKFPFARDGFQKLWEKASVSTESEANKKQ